MRAKPIFTYSLVAGALAFPGHALALGLGKLTVESALGQPLSARIELTSVTKDDLDSLRARIADPGQYRQNNLTYQGTLSRARVSLESVGGTPYLKVTSPVSVQEPFLDLLVELDWASGRVVREYTFLLDPPGLPMAAAAEAIAPPRAATPARTSAAPAAQAPVPTVSAAAPAASGGAPSGGGQYTVRSGDTLQKIATQYKPADVTLDQMLAAFFRGNQSAFEGDNMNRLRAGAILNVPSASDAQATPAAEATKIVRVQASDWRTYRDRIAAAAPAATGGAARESSGRIGAAVEERTPAAAPGADKLRVSREAGVGKGGAAAENAIARDQQLKDAQTRIAALEKTIADLQRAVELKNETLAQLQTQADASKGKVPAPAAEAGAAPATPAAAGTATPAPAAAPSPAAPAAAAPEPKPATTAPAPAKAPAAKAPAPKAEPPGFFADLLSSTPNWALGAGALAILGGIAALVAARRRKATKFEDSIISGTDIKTNTVFGSTGGGVVNTGDNSLASDFSREGLGNIDTDEVDPIAEAEVYLAYGRDAQAEEILKDALKKDSQRQEIYLKLLEIHSQHNKPQAFETVASELFAVSHGQGDVWHKAVTLGRQLDPANPMFQDAGSAAQPAAASKTSAAVERSPLHASPAFNDGDISIAPEAAAPAKSAAEILAGARDALARSASTPVAAVAATQGASTTAAETASAATAALAGTLAAGKSHLEDMFASGKAHLADAANELTTRVDTPAEQPRFDLDFQLDDLDHPAPLKPASQPKPEPSLAAASTPFGHPARPLELDKLDLSFNPDRPAFEDPTPSVMDGQWHDAATKLDLAKAYQEMGDFDGAREILQEVLHEGDDQQKSEAQSLLAKLAS
ncbi:MAG TPA: FimV/HubP family polar landmark protein [Casimicrobiaceae bacterium]